jgi:hypothetical protein
LSDDIVAKKAYCCRSEIEQSILKHNKQDLTDLNFGV